MIASLTASKRAAVLAAMLSISIVSACTGGSSGGSGGGGSAQPPPPAPTSVILEIIRRDLSGSLTGVAGIEVHRNDATTGAFIETKITDAAGRADFGVQQGPVTLSVVRAPSAGAGPVWAYTLLGLPPGTARLRLDRLPGEPATVLATVGVSLSPALTSTEEAEACLPSGCKGEAAPSAIAISGVAIADRDIQDDGLVTLVAEVKNGESGNATGCRTSADQSVPANGALLPASMSNVTPGDITTSGALSLSRVVAVRKGVAFSLRPFPTCAVAITGATGFSLQGDIGAGYSDRQVPNYFREQQSAIKNGALWVAWPELDPSILRTLPSADATIEALSYDSGIVHYTLKGSDVRPLVAARTRIIWSPSGAIFATGPIQLPPDARVWYVYNGMAVNPASCDGTSTDPDCSFVVKLPDLAAVGLPANQVNGTQISVEALAPASANNSVSFWSRLAAEGDVEAVLARGYTGAYRDMRLSKMQFTLNAGDYITNSPNYSLGRVTGTGGIDCGGPQHPYPTPSCDANLPGGTTVTLSATPNSGAEFVEWVGLCAAFATPGSPSVTFVLDRTQSCTPKFRSQSGGKALNVGIIGTVGLIMTDDGFISCGWDAQGNSHTNCFFNYSSGSTIQLHAFSSDPLNAYDVLWSGDCTGTAGLTATLIMDAPKNCGVEFVPR